MLKFFRKIRQELLKENRFSKYLMYAIGEIALVMIGILLAVNVNNWNIAQERTKQEIAVLQQLSNDFELSLLDLKDNYKTHARGINSAKIILSALENDLAYTDTMEQHFGELGMTRFISTTGAYESLKSIGFDLIRNDSLRNKIIQIHDEYYESISTFDAGMFLKYSYVLESFVKYYDQVTWKAKPLDFEALKNSEEYKTILRTHIFQLEILQKYLYTRVIHRIESLQLEIQKEIDSIKE